MTAALLVLTLTLTLTLAGAPAAPAAAAGSDGGAESATRTLAKWSIFVYLDADNDLHSYGLEDLEEMKAAGTNADVNVIVLFDGSGNADSKYLKIEGGSATQLQHLGEVNMADPQTLEDFLDWGLQAYPARRNALIIWDHGDGIFRRSETNATSGQPDILKGFCTEGGWESIELHEFRDVLDNVQPHVYPVGGTFDIIGFDCCLMGQIETAYQCIPYADYIVFSEMTEPVSGWVYDESFGAVIDDPDLSTEAFCEQLVDDYYDDFSGYGATSLSAIDLDALENTFTAPFNTLCNGLINEMYNYGNTIDDLRSQAESYDQYSYYAPDLYHFVDLVSQSAQLPAYLTQQAEAVLATEAETVVSVRNRGYSTANARGMTIYFPQDSVIDEYAAECDFVAERWDEFLDEYHDPSAAHLRATTTVTDHDGDGHDDDVAITVYDTANEPLPGASVSIDGTAIGTTGTDGQITADDFDKGVHIVHASHDGLFTNAEFVIQNRRPVAQFALPAPAPAESEVVFDGSASSDPDGDPLSYVWDFGDGVTGTGREVTHRFANDGMFTVELRVFDDDRATHNVTRLFEVLNIEPVARAGNDQLVNEDTRVVFDASASSDTPNDIPTLEYRWDFDDGNATEWAANATANHTYAHAGSYIVELSVRDKDGAAATDLIDIVVSNIPPRANCTDTISCYEDDLVRLDGSTSFDSASDIPTLRYHWDLGDGTTTEGAICTHRYEDFGRYTVTLTVTDDDRAEDSCTTEVYVTNRAPVAVASGEGTTIEVYEDELVTLDGDDSYDTPSDRDQLQYYWSVNDGSKMSGYRTAVAAHRFPNSGVWEATLTVTDDDGAQSTARVNISVINIAPEALAPEALVVNEGASIYLSGENSSDTPSDQTSLSYGWDLDGDGAEDAMGATVLARFDTPGSLDITLTVTDDDHASDTATITVTVNAGPVPIIVAPEVMVATESRIFSSSSSYDTDGQILERYWDLDCEVDSDGDGDAANDIDSRATAPEFAYDTAGRYRVKLTVVDDRGMSASETFEVRVDPAPNAIIECLTEPSIGNLGIFIYAAVGVLFIVLIALLVRRRKRRKRTEEAWSNNDTDEDTGGESGRELGGGDGFLDYEYASQPLSSDGELGSADAEPSYEYAYDAGAEPVPGPSNTDNGYPAPEQYATDDDHGPEYDRWNDASDQYNAPIPDRVDAGALQTESQRDDEHDGEWAAESDENGWDNGGWDNGVWDEDDVGVDDEGEGDIGRAWDEDEDEDEDALFSDGGGLEDWQQAW